MFQKRLHYLEAQIEMSIHNLKYFEKRVSDQEVVIALLGEDQDEEEETRDDTQEQLDQMEQKQKAKEDFWKDFWRSKVLEEQPFTRKNAQKRKNLDARKHEALFDIDKTKQEALEQTLILTERRLQEIAEESYEEELNLQSLQETLNFHSSQTRVLLTIRNNELFRRENMNNE